MYKINFKKNIKDTKIFYNFKEYQIYNNIMINVDKIIYF